MFAPEGDINQDTLVSDTELQQYIFFPENFLYDLLSGFILIKLLLFLAPRPSPISTKSVCQMFDVETGHLMSPMSAILSYKDIGTSAVQ